MLDEYEHRIEDLQLSIARFEHLERTGGHLVSRLEVSFAGMYQLSARG